MRKKKASLSEALSKQEDQNQSKKAVQGQDASLSETKPSRYPLPPSRQGKKSLTVYLDPAVIKQLKIIGLEIETTNQNMVSDALNDFFLKHGKSPIA